MKRLFKLLSAMLLVFTLSGCTNYEEISSYEGYTLLKDTSTDKIPDPDIVGEWYLYGKNTTTCVEVLQDDGSIFVECTGENKHVVFVCNMYYMNDVYKFNFKGEDIIFEDGFKDNNINPAILEELLGDLTIELDGGEVVEMILE